MHGGSGSLGHGGGEGTDHGGLDSPFFIEGVVVSGRVVGLVILGLVFV